MNDREVGQALMKRRALIWRAAFAVTSSRDDSDDIAAESIARLWGARARLPEVCNLDAYVITVTRRVALDMLRSRAYRTPTVSLDDISPLTADETPDSLAESKADLDLVEALIGTLPENQRKVILYTAYEGLDSGEIAQRTGLSLQNVRTLLSRGRSRLRTLFNKNDI